MRAWLVPLAVAAIAVAVAWTIRFGTDDAYIAFTYARDLARGDGPTWFGDHVEGYTSFSWVLWTAGGLRLGADPLVWAWVGSLAALAGALVATYRLARLRAGDVSAACAIGIAATNFTFLAFGTSGLETMAQTALLALAWLEVERLLREPPSATALAWLSTTAALALWTRLDSAVVLVVLGAVAAHRLVRVRAARTVWIAAIAPAALAVAGWFAWKLAYYGDVLPNTFYVKIGTGAVAQGARYVLACLHAYLWWPPLAAAAVLAIVRRGSPSRLPAALAAAWCAYVIAVGGDFMEFRFIVPIVPALAVVIAELVSQRAPAHWPDARLRAAATVALLATASIHHAATFDRVSDDSYDSIAALGTFYGRVRNGDWGELGRTLRATLAGSSATLACNGAGAIPYYADLPTVDQLGLNDRWIARHGATAPEGYRRPGHQRFAPYDYLIRRGVTFVIGTPTTIRRGRLAAIPRDMEVWVTTLLGFAPLPRDLELDVVAAPIDDDRSLLLWYLTPTPEITARIRAAGWDRVIIKSSRSPAAQLQSSP